MSRINPGNPINRRRHPIGDDRVPPQPSSFILLPRDAAWRTQGYTYTSTSSAAKRRSRPLVSQPKQCNPVSRRAASKRQPAGMCRDARYKRIKCTRLELPYDNNKIHSAAIKQTDDKRTIFNRTSGQIKIETKLNELFPTVKIIL